MQLPLYSKIVRNSSEFKSLPREPPTARFYPPNTRTAGPCPHPSYSILVASVSVSQLSQGSHLPVSLLPINLWEVCYAEWLWSVPWFSAARISLHLHCKAYNEPWPCQTFLRNLIFRKGNAHFENPFPRSSYLYEIFTEPIVKNINKPTFPES